jgi:hypothetical protein
MADARIRAALARFLTAGSGGGGIAWPCGSTRRSRNARHASPGTSSGHGTGERSKTPNTGEHRSASAADLMIAATAAHHGLTVLHDDADYRTVARHASDFSEHNIRDVS